MKVLLVNTNRNTLPMPVMPIGACMVAEAAEQAGHQVEFLDLMFEKHPLPKIAAALAREKPDVIGLSVRNIDNNDMRNPVNFMDELQHIVATVRTATAAPIVLGGAALGVMPEAILRLVPACCGVPSDGELVFPRILNRLAAGQPITDLPGVAWIENDRYRHNAEGGKAGGSVCPAPDYSRWLNLSRYRSHLTTVPVQSKLGCPFRCVYCTYRKLEGGTSRVADPRQVAEAVDKYAAAGLRDIEFVDSIFNVPYDHALAVCDALAKTRHKARLQSLELNPANLDDTLLTAMERAGFVGIGITVESVSDPVLDGLQKGFTATQVRRAAVVVRRHRLPCTWIFLFGGPGETPATVEETLQFAENAIRPEDVAFFNLGLRIYPGTELENIARRQGLLNRASGNLLDPVFYLSPAVDAEWLQRRLQSATDRNLNFISSGTLGLSFLPALHYLGYWAGIQAPLWRHTRLLRRAMQCLGVATG